MDHPVQCSCGSLKGVLRLAEGANRCVCYCADCQAFAHFLKHDAQILDAAGGTDIIQTIPKNLTFTEGVEKLACMRLTPNGLLRWYAACCNTPIGNAPANFKMSYIGLVHNCLRSERGSLKEAFGPVRMCLHTKFAKGEPKPKSVGLAAGFFRTSLMLLKARLDGSYKHTPFFFPESGAPIVTPNVLSDEELNEVTNAV